MQSKSISEIEQEYDLEIKKIVSTIKKEKAKLVLLQFPDGLKPHSTVIAEELRNQTDNQCEFIIWMGTCYGACDLPLGTERMGIDLIIQFGHSKWPYNEKGIKILN
jgi:diphthamide biosynthesis enzyme Dph1/Dph2-like protein